MKKLFPILFLFISSIGFTQNTLIPDANFEQALINLGLDTAPINGSVPTANIDTLSVLNIDNKSISNLAGIEDFTALTSLSCWNNLITSLVLTQNTALTYLDCSSNQISSLDITQNTLLDTLACAANLLNNLNVTQNSNLTGLFCSQNQLSSLDLTQNTGLNSLNCSSNSLSNIDITQNTVLNNLVCNHNNLSYLDLTLNTTLNWLFCNSTQLINLDLSQNPVLTNLYCHDNPLECINLKNGNNINLLNFSASNNPNLTCVEVDNIQWSIANWLAIDDTLSYQDSCYAACANPIGINELQQPTLSIYPNPTSSELTIETEESITKIEIIDITGKTIKTITPSLNRINVTELPEGVYFIRIISEENIITHKFIKQ